MAKILITGGAGFIGYSLAKAMLDAKHELVLLDNLNDYYEQSLKYARLADLGFAVPAGDEMLHSSIHPQLRFVRIDLSDFKALSSLFENEKFDVVCNLAAQAGVRYSLTHPFSYLHSNLTGFLNILECCRNFSPKHLVFASSSSVYGINKKQPYATEDKTDHPISLYAATKKSNELMGHTYSYLYGIPMTGLRFFTVYGPWGRPDMAYFSFTRAILENKPIKVFNQGKLKRDFTYIDDIVAGIRAVLEGAPPVTGDETSAPFKLYNIGNSKPVNLLDFIAELEHNLGKEAIKEFVEMQPGDVKETWADTDPLYKDFNFQPKVEIKEGLKKFIDWYKTYYSIATVS